MIQKTRDKLMLENTEGVMKKDNPYKLAIQDIQETRQIRTIQGNQQDTGKNKCQRIWKG